MWPKSLTLPKNLCNFNRNNKYRICGWALTILACAGSKFEDFSVNENYERDNFISLMERHGKWSSSQPGSQPGQISQRSSLSSTKLDQIIDSIEQAAKDKYISNFPTLTVSTKNHNITYYFFDYTDVPGQDPDRNPKPGNRHFRSWFSAGEFCRQRGLNLAMFTCLEEFDVFEAKYKKIADEFGYVDYWWVGGRFDHGEAKWFWDKRYGLEKGDYDPSGSGSRNRRSHPGTSTSTSQIKKNFGSATMGVSVSPLRSFSTITKDLFPIDPAIPNWSNNPMDGRSEYCLLLTVSELWRPYKCSRRSNFICEHRVQGDFNEENEKPPAFLKGITYFMCDMRDEKKSDYQSCVILDAGNKTVLPEFAKYENSKVRLEMERPQASGSEEKRFVPKDFKLTPDTSQLAYDLQPLNLTLSSLNVLSSRLRHLSAFWPI